jgi:ATP-binding cassette subfamily B protein
MTDPPKQKDQAPLRSKLGEALSQLRYLPRTARLVWAASGRWTLVWLAALLVQGLLPVAAVLLTRVLVDGVVAAIDAGGTWESIRAIALPAGLLAGALVLGEVLRGVATWARANQAQLIEDHIASLIHEQSTAVDLAFYETPDYYDHLHRARNEAWHRPQKLTENAGTLVQSAVTLLAMAGVLLSFSAWVPLVLLLSTLPALLAVLRHAVRQHRWRLRNTEAERKAWYYDWELTSSETAAELRLFDLGGHFKHKFRSVRERLRRERLALIRDQSLSELAAGAIALLATLGCLAWIGVRTIEGLFTLGQLALFYGAFRQGQQMLRSVLGNMGDIYRNILFLGDLFAFLDLVPGVGDPDRPAKAPETLETGITFEDVTFAYPGCDEPVLEGFDLQIRAGAITAIVGANGSGKSTLLKLICRLYDPSAGRVDLDGTDLRQLAAADLRRRITVMFQTPVQYSDTAAENIALGDEANEHTKAEIETAAAAAGAAELVSRLPDRYETLLGKWFEGGTELSAGEWQRLALARAFLRRAPLILLDEPTSSMDSWAEADWTGRFRSLVEGRTALVITHRFTTAMGADMIHVMDRGRIIESGSHDELLARKGAYAESWAAQMSQKPRSRHPIG